MSPFLINFNTLPLRLVHSVESGKSLLSRSIGVPEVTSLLFKTLLLFKYPPTTLYSYNKPLHQLLCRFFVLKFFILSTIMSIVGRYEMKKSENFGSYLEAAGVNMLKRAAAAAAKPTVEITEADGVWTLKTLSMFKDTVITFKSGEEFDEETADGRKCKSVVTVEGNKMTHQQRIEPDEATTVREFTDEGMTATFKCKDAVATRFYARMAS